MASLIKILKNDSYNYRWSVDGNAYGEDYDVTTQDGFSDPTLEKAGWERVLKVNGSLFYTYDSKHYACGLEKAFGVNHQDASMTAVSDYNSCMAIACLEDGSLVFDTQSNIIDNYLSSAYAAITGLGVLLNGESVDMHSGFDTQWNQISGRTVIGVDKNGNFLSYSFEGATGTSGLTGEEVQSKCVELGFYTAIMLDGGGSVFREYFRSYDISTTRSVKNALLLYRKRKTNLFIPRTSKTIPSNMQYTSAVTNWNRWWYENTFNAGATASVCLPNCTTYVMGRSGEIAGKSCRDNEIMNRTGFPNASDWFSNAKWETGQTPKLGAIACWTDNGNNWGGHVAIVEATDGTNENTYLSMSGYQDASSGTRSFTNPGKDASWYYQYLDFTTTNYYYTTYDSRGGSFLGYIYNPYIGITTSITSSVSKDTTKNQIKLNDNVTLNVRVDPSVQSQTLGTITTDDSYYNVLSISTDDDYTWYQIGNDNYVADDGTWVTYYEATSTIQYTISTSVSPENSGVVTGGGTYDKGSTCTLTAKAATDYKFASWSDGSTSNPHTIIVDADLIITANFNYITPVTKYTVTSTILPTAASSSGCYVDGLGSYVEGETVTLNAIAQGAYKFSAWSNGSTTNPYVFTINSDTNIDCNFAVDETKYTVTITYDSVIGAVTGAGTYSKGDSVTIQANLNSDYRFDAWNIDDSTSQTSMRVSSNPYTFIINSNVSITLVTTDLKKYKTIDVTSNNTSYGRVSGGGEYEVGSQCTLRAIANYSYVFEKWSNDVTDSVYAFEVSDNLSLIGYFKKTSISAELITVNGESNVTENLNVTFNNYDSSRTYKFLWSVSIGGPYTEWGNISSPSINLVVNNTFEQLLPSTKSGTFYLNVEAYDSSSELREYQYNIPFIVNIPDTFGIALSITSEQTHNLFNDALYIANYSSLDLYYKYTLTAPSGYTNHATLNTLVTKIDNGDIKNTGSFINILCAQNNNDYTSNYTITGSDGRGNTQTLSGKISVEGYYSPRFSLKKLELQKATDTKYNCFIAFALDVAEIENNSLDCENVIITINGNDYVGVQWDDYNGYWYSTVGDSNLENKTYQVTVSYQDSVIKYFTPLTRYSNVQSLGGKLPLSLYDDTEGNVGVALGVEASTENVVNLGLNTTFGTGVQLNASKYDDNGKLLETSLGAYELLSGGGEDSVKKVDTVRGGDIIYANKIRCMTGTEYNNLSTKDPNTLYFLTSVN